MQALLQYSCDGCVGNIRAPLQAKLLNELAIICQSQNSALPDLFAQIKVDVFQFGQGVFEKVGQALGCPEVALAETYSFDLVAVVDLVC